MSSLKTKTLFSYPCANQNSRKRWREETLENTDIFFLHPRQDSPSNESGGNVQHRSWQVLFPSEEPTYAVMQQPPQRVLALSRP